MSSHLRTSETFSIWCGMCHRKSMIEATGFANRCNKWTLSCTADRTAQDSWQGQAYSGSISRVSINNQVLRKIPDSGAEKVYLQWFYIFHTVTKSYDANVACSRFAPFRVWCRLSPDLHYGMTKPRQKSWIFPMRTNDGEVITKSAASSFINIHIHFALKDAQNTIGDKFPIHFTRIQITEQSKQAWPHAGLSFRCPGDRWVHLFRSWALSQGMSPTSE